MWVVGPIVVIVLLRWLWEDYTDIVRRWLRM
jgi:hypothetical protein